MGRISDYRYAIAFLITIGVIGRHARNRDSRFKPYNVIFFFFIFTTFTTSRMREQNSWVMPTRDEMPGLYNGVMVARRVFGGIHDPEDVRSKRTISQFIFFSIVRFTSPLIEYIKRSIL